MTEKTTQAPRVIVGGDGVSTYQTACGFCGATMMQELKGKQTPKKVCKPACKNNKHWLARYLGEIQVEGLSPEVRQAILEKAKI